VVKLIFGSIILFFFRIDEELFVLIVICEILGVEVDSIVIKDDISRGWRSGSMRLIIRYQKVRFLPPARCRWYHNGR
jgi:hypothetical protein